MAYVLYRRRAKVWSHEARNGLVPPWSGPIEMVSLSHHLLIIATATKIKVAMHPPMMKSLIKYMSMRSSYERPSMHQSWWLLALTSSGPCLDSPLRAYTSSSAPFTWSCTHVSFVFLGWGSFPFVCPKCGALGNPGATCFPWMRGWVVEGGGATWGLLSLASHLSGCRSHESNCWGGRRKSPTVDTMRLSVLCDFIIDYSFTLTPRAKTPPYFLKPCVQIVLTTYNSAPMSDNQCNPA